MQKTIDPDVVINFLNAALALDPEAITALMSQRVKCNRALGDHPTIQVGRWPIDGLTPAPTLRELSEREPGALMTDDGKSELKVGVLGLLNGLCGANEEGWGFITAYYDEYPGPIIRFERTHLRQKKDSEDL